MSSVASKNPKLDKLYLKFFKYAVVGLMTLALLSIVVLLPMAAYQYFQKPLPPTPAKAAPEREVSLEDLKKFLIEEEKRRVEQEKSGGTSASKQSVGSSAVTSLYAEQALALYRCAEDFRKLAEQDTDNASEAEISARRESQRANIERLAQDQFRGPGWPNAMVAFTCNVLRSAEIAKLKKDKTIGSVVNPAIHFHARAWAAIERERAEFRQAEERRVQGEVAAEAARVAQAKARALFLLSAAGGAVLFFLLMALYLIFAKIEDNLALIHQAIVLRTLPSSDAV